MATDCEKLTPNAQKIFGKLKPYFPPDPWQNPQWMEDGRVHDNGWHDLRTSADRQKLIDHNLHVLGHYVKIHADDYRKNHGSLDEFDREHFSRAMQHVVERLLILEDLDFQIETIDIVESA